MKMEFKIKFEMVLKINLKKKRILLLPVSFGLLAQHSSPAGLSPFPRTGPPRPSS
jgi:hypothetical protein